MIGSALSAVRKKNILKNYSGNTVAIGFFACIARSAAYDVSKDKGLFQVNALQTLDSLNRKCIQATLKANFQSFG